MLLNSVPKINPQRHYSVFSGANFTIATAIRFFFAVSISQINHNFLVSSYYKYINMLAYGTSPSMFFPKCNMIQVQQVNPK